MVKRFLLFLLIISFFFIFSSREVNYDDITYLDNGKYISENGFKNIIEREWTFHSQTVRLTDGTHSLVPMFFYSLFLRFNIPMKFMHLIIYVIYALMLFPLERIFLHLKVKNPLPLSVLFLVSPAITVYANSFMPDIPAFSLLIFAVFFLLKQYKEKKYVYVLLFVLFTIISILFSYTSFFIFPLILFAFDESRKKNNLIMIMFTFIIVIIIIAIMNFFGAAPTLFKAIRWLGSEKIFNYHKTLEKILALFVWVGFFAFPAILNKIKIKIFPSTVLLISVIVISIVYTSSMQNNISKIIFFLLFFLGTSAVFSLYDKKENLLLKYIILGIGLTTVLFFPMVIGRYLFVFFFMIASQLFRDKSFKSILFNIVLCVLISSVLLTSDMIQSKIYSNLNFVYGSNQAKKRFVIGEWGYRFQAEKKGIEPFNFSKNNFNSSDVLFVPLLENVSDISRFTPYLKLIKTDSAFNFPVKLLSKEGSSGYYTSMYGILPFSISNEYSIKNYIYEYIEYPNPHIMKYIDRIVFWNGKIVIPSHTNDTLIFDSEGNDSIEIVFFPDTRVLMSDGIIIFLSVIDSTGKMIEIKRALFTPKKTGFIIMEKRNKYFVTFSQNENDSFDWFGLSPK